MTVECPACRAQNPSSASVCQQCNRPIDVAAKPAGAPEAANGAPRRPEAPKTRPARAPLPAGTVLAGRYEIQKTLGEGGMGAVYQALDRELDRVVAVKVVRPELAGHREVLHRFKQELILARQITHRNIIRIFDLGADNGRPFITMEFVEGTNLRAMLAERGKFSPAEATAIIHQVMEGLEAAHAEGVIHRDLKPQNIIVDPHGRVCLMDFGIARSMEVDGMTRTGVLVGTPDYMSPEQAMGEKLDTRSDLFSAGVLFYELLTGVQPYHEKTMMATLVKRTTEKAIPPRKLDAGIPQHVSEIVSRCLEIDRNLRYQTAGEIIRDLDQAKASPPAAAPSVDTAGALEPGSRLGSRYVIEALLGEGGMGKVYRAQDTELGRTVALKMVRADLTANPAAMELLKQEILLASRITHKNILRIYDLGEAGGVKFISMAFVDGQDLFRLIERTGPLELSRALAIARQICLALDAAHAEGIVHLDLKPQNVLLGAGEEVYVSDFGLARPLEAGAAGAESGEITGTPRYMSPEQIESQPVDHRSDLYSFGLILYEMLTGDVPFASETVMQALYQRVTRPPKNPKLLRPDLPEHYVRILFRCLEKNPAARYQSARELLADLDAAPAERKVVTITVGSWRRPAAAVAVVAALAAGAVFAVPGAREAIFGGHKSGPAAAPAPAVKYLAVLPFRMLGSQEQLAYAADGVTDSLTAKLMNLKDVHVVSPAAAAKVDQKASLDRIAHSLGARYVVSGAVQGGAGKLAIVASLDDGTTGRRVWTREFSGVPDDLLTLQDQIYSEILGALELKPGNDELARGATRLTENIGAYELYLKGRALLRGNRDEKNVKAALGSFEDATKQDARFALAYTGVADASLYLYNLTKDGAWAGRSLGAARRAEDLNANLPEVHYSLGAIYAATGRSGQAVAELKRAIDLSPNSDEGWRRLGRALLDMGDRDGGLNAFRKAADVNPYYWANYNALGSAYFQVGENAGAMKAFQKVTELEPKRAIGWANIGVMLYRQGQWEQCLPALQRALDLEPQQDIYSNLGTAYFFLHRYPESRTMFERAVALNPIDYHAAGNLADAYRWSGDSFRTLAAQTYQRAISLALKALQVNPRDASALGALGTYYAKSGDPARALDFIHRARALDPNDVDLMYQSALIEVLAGQNAQALQDLKLALDKHYSVKEAANDPELQPLRDNREFQSLIAQAR